MSLKLFFALTTVLVLFAGCNGPASESSPTAEADSSDPSAAGNSPLSLPVINLEPTDTPRPVADTSQPDSVVLAFLDALRDGNDEIAEALLTTIARRETKVHELAVRPPGSPSARYEIGEVKYVQGGVHVNSIWSEADEAGEQSVYEIVWVLRQEPIGWRVAGMATAVNPAKPPIYLNFEDVPDLLQKWRQADAELAARAEQASAVQASQPGSTLHR